MLKRMETLDDLHNIIIYKCRTRVKLWYGEHDIVIHMKMCSNTRRILYYWGVFPIHLFCGNSFVREYKECITYEISSHDLMRSNYNV